MVWSEQRKLLFSCIIVKGVNHKKKNLTYQDLPFARIPTPQCDDAPVYVFTTLPSLPIHINVQDDQSNAMEEYLDPDFQAE